MKQGKTILFPIIVEGKVFLKEFQWNDIVKIFLREQTRNGPKYSGITIDHLTAVGVSSMRQNLSNEIFTKKVLSALKILKKENEDFDGTIGVISLVKQLHSVFNYRPQVKTLESPKIRTLRKCLCRLFLWRDLIEMGIKDRKKNKISGKWTMASCFIDNDNFMKFVINSKSLLLFSERCITNGIPLFFREPTSQREVENIFNLARNNSKIFFEKF